jgi:hypothetical protein
MFPHCSPWDASSQGILSRNESFLIYLSYGSVEHVYLGCLAL